MRVLKDDFQAGQPASAISADWLNSVAAFINKLTGRNGLAVNRSGEYPAVELSMPSSAPSEDLVLKCKTGTTTVQWEAVNGSMGNSPTDNTGANHGGEEASSLSFTNWTNGGQNGLKLRLYALVDEVQGDGHYFQPIDIDITNTGAVKSVTAVQNKGIFIGA